MKGLDYTSFQAHFTVCKYLLTLPCVCARTRTCACTCACMCKILLLLNRFWLNLILCV